MKIRTQQISKKVQERILIILAFKLLSELLSESPWEQPEDIGNGNKYDKIVVLFPFGGRIDHTLGNISTLWSFQTEYPSIWEACDILLLDEVSTMQLLPAGLNYIWPAIDVQARKGVGLVPLMGKCEKIKTQGLKWNIGNPEDWVQQIDFGKCKFEN